jgi:hypothetical protein
VVVEVIREVGEEKITVVVVVVEGCLGTQGEMKTL